MGQLKKLFEPIKIGDVELKNRMVMLGLTSNYGDKGRITDRIKEFYAERARGGVGLITFGYMTPTNDVGAELDGEQIHKDELIPDLRQLVDIIHRNGAKVSAQLCLRYTWRKTEDAPLEYVSPSPITTGPHIKEPRELTVEEIQQIVGQFGDAARRAREAGFDLVEFHCGLGYLISRFISPCTNQRTDEYGGSLEKRMRFFLEVLEDSQKKAGADYTFQCRMAADDLMKGGHTLEDSQQVARIMQDAGVACLNVQAGWNESPVPLVQAVVPRAGYIHLAEGIKKVVDIPVVGAYRINDPFVAEQILEEGKADLIGMCRALIADPEFPNKAREGRFDDIRRCIACNNCLDVIFDREPVTCTVNARAGREVEYAIAPAPKPRKVFIVGGGPAGMEAARVAAQRGHKVTLYDDKDKLGGQLHLAATPPHKGEINNLMAYLTAQIEKAQVEVKLGEKVTAEKIIGAQPEVTIVAEGSSHIIPDIPGVHGDNVVIATEVLTGAREVGERVVIAGGGLIGCETADFLVEKGKQVTILEMLPRLGADIGRTSRWVIRQRLRKAGVRMETNTRVEEITKEGVKAVREGASEFFEADTVVIAVGMKSNQELAKELEGKVAELHVIGDAAEPRRIRYAIEGGLRVAREI